MPAGVLRTAKGILVMLFAVLAIAGCIGYGTAPSDAACESRLELGYQARLETMATPSLDAPAPTIGWEDAVRACAGAHPEIRVYEDGTVVLYDTDYEYPPFTLRISD